MIMDEVFCKDPVLLVEEGIEAAVGEKLYAVWDLEVRRC